MTAALVGVVIPTRNGERHLAAALDSVLAQTHETLDVVVADDGSSDSTRDVARDYSPEVRCLALPHRGLGATRNAGVAAVRGSHVGFLDQDDIWEPTKLEHQLEAFDRSSPPDLAFGHVREFLSPELEPQRADEIRCVPHPRPAALPGTMLAARASMARVGPFEERWVSNDFMAWLLAARRLRLREVMLSEVVLRRRLHDSNFSHRAGLTRREYTRVLKDALDLRRA
jgi:glycosyltransferase involved in cell wall biosynthesis